MHNVWISCEIIYIVTSLLWVKVKVTWTGHIHTDKKTENRIKIGIYQIKMLEESTEGIYDNTKSIQIII